VIWSAGARFGGGLRLLLASRRSASFVSLRGLFADCPARNAVVVAQVVVQAEPAARLGKPRRMVIPSQPLAAQLNSDDRSHS